MSFWIRALCTKPLGTVTVEDLRRATEASDFSMMAESQGLDDDDGDAAEETLRFEGPPGPLTNARMYYRPDAPALFIAIERWIGDEARGEAQELLQSVDVDARRIRDVLERTMESVAFCLAESDVDGMGWPIAWHTAMWLAQKGGGLVEGEGEWWDPDSYEKLTVG